MEKYDDDIDKIDELKAKKIKLEKDPDIYSTLETVFDHKTRLILFKRIRNGLIDEVNGAISTGKEANVYYCPGKKALACKIYRIGSPSFQKMKQYVVGDYRFRKFRRSSVGFIQEWARKEFKNLQRLRKAGINVPEPIEVDRNVLFLELLSNENGTLPKLNEAVIKDRGKVYKEIMEAIQIMYQEAKLIHADLSPFNILFDDILSKYYIIDVSQSVLNDHPMATIFLLRDIKIINEYFYSLGVKIIEIRKLFRWVTKEDADEADVLRVLNKDFK